MRCFGDWVKWMKNENMRATGFSLYIVEPCGSYAPMMDSRYSSSGSTVYPGKEKNITVCCLLILILIDISRGGSS